jgi:hypothetical protein
VQTDTGVVLHALEYLKPTALVLVPITLNSRHRVVITCDQVKLRRNITQKIQGASLFLRLSRRNVSKDPNLIVLAQALKLIVDYHVMMHSNLGVT